MRQHQKPYSFWGPKSRPWTLAARDSVLVMCDLLCPLPLLKILTMYEGLLSVHVLTYSSPPKQQHFCRMNTMREPGQTLDAPMSHATRSRCGSNQPERCENNISFVFVNTGWPRKNTTPTINNFKKTRGKTKKLCVLMCIEFFSQQNDTQDYSFWWRHFDSMAVLLRQCHFQNLPLLSQKSPLTYRKFPLFGSPGENVCSCFEKRRQHE